MITQKQFVKLAGAYIQQDKYEFDVLDTIRSVAEKHKQETDFLGLPYRCGFFMEAVLDILGDDFSYYHYECEDDFEEFNSRITLKDGSHPSVHSLEDLYNFGVKEGSIK